jgi:diguanylate cyclase (GGDEF)-like protein
MVEILDGLEKREKLLSRRVEKLTAELDQLESDHKQAVELLGQLTKTFCGLHESANPEISSAIDQLLAAAAQKPIDLNLLTEKLDGLQNARMTEDNGQDVQRVIPSLEDGSPDPAGDLEHQEALLGAVDALARLAPADHESTLAKAIEELRQAVKARPFDPEPVMEASEAVKHALITHQEDAKQHAPDPANGKLGGPPDDGKAAAGWYLAESLLKGMRMGDEAFDADLDKSIKAVADYLESGELDRPVMGMAADLMEQFRSLLYKRHQDAHGALMEIVGELLKTEAGLLRSVEGSGGKLLDSGAENQRELDRRLSHLATDINQAGDLAGLKVRAMEQISQLKDHMLARINWQAQMVNETMQKANEMRQAMQDAKIRISMAEDKSRRWGRAALTDSLTGVWNKRALELMLLRSVDDPSNVFSLVLFDMDGFRALVGSWGTQAADKALISIAEHVKDCLREEDYLFRHSSDFFTAFLSGAGAKTASQVAERIRDRVSTISFSFQGFSPVRLTATLVVAQPKEGEGPDEFWGRAEHAMHRIKQLGGTGRVHRI